MNVSPASVDWDDVRLFLAAARCGGFGAAARALGTQQSTVSRRVAALEQRLGAALFDRQPGGLELTRLGRRVQAQAEPAEAALQGVTDLVSEEEREVAGVVRVALTETTASLFVIPHVLPGLLAMHPRLEVDLVTGNHASDLRRREADIAVRFFLERRGDLVTRRVARMPTGVLAHRRLVARLSRVSPAQWPWVSVWRASGSALEESWVERFGPRPRLTTNSFHAQFELVRAGLGVAVLPLAVTRAVPELVPLPLPAAQQPPLVDTWLVTPRAHRRVPRVAAVFSALLEGLAVLGEGASVR
jgi:DNA-binding transcriptional LysR family regulator